MSAPTKEQERLWQEEDDRFRERWDRECEKLNRAVDEERAKQEARHEGQYTNGHDKNAKVEINPQVFDARDWGGLPRPIRRFLDGRKWFRANMVSNLSGPGGIGKTLVALQACVAIASGTQWLNHPINAGPVIFFSAEEHKDEIWTRIDEICEAENLMLKTLPYPLRVIDVSHEPVAALIEAASGKDGKVLLTLTALYRWLDQYMTKVKPVAIFIDNRAQVIVGNENDRGVAGFSMRMLASLAAKHDCAVILLSHPSQTGTKTGASGSTQWFNTARSNVYMHRPNVDAGEEDDLIGDDGTRELINNKTNYAPGDSTAALKWEFNRWVCTDPLPKTDSDIGKADRAERVFLKLLDRLISRGFDVSPLKTSANFVITQMRTEPKIDLEGVNGAALFRAMKTLIDAKRIEVYESGPPSQKKKHLRIVELQP